MFEERRYSWCMRVGEEVSRQRGRRRDRRLRWDGGLQRQFRSLLGSVPDDIA